MKSLIKEIGPVQFPAHTGERIYMLPFTKRAGLPKALSRWQPTINAMLHGIDVDGPIYLMIDQGFVAAGKTHRRGGAHIDGNWNPETFSHGGGGSHGPRHAPRKNTPQRSGVWHHEDFAPEALILASNVSASCAYVGEFEGDPAEGGDCSHLNLSGAAVVPLRRNVAYVGNVTMIHESTPVKRDSFRTLVRLNVPGYEFQ